MKDSISQLNLIGGNLCLDFVNTIDWRGTKNPHEYLQQCSDLIMWAKHVGILTANQTEKLLRDAAGNKKKAGETLKRALHLRELIYQIFAGSKHFKDLEEFNRILKQVTQWRKISADHKTYHWTWQSFGQSLDSVLWPIVQSAAELLTSDDLQHVRECSGSGARLKAPDCGWLFLDLSRNHSRKWCDMSSCGNRSKVLRHYYRQKQSANI